jgi:hypothetical protein
VLINVRTVSIPLIYHHEIPFTLMTSLPPTQPICTNGGLRKITSPVPSDTDGGGYSGIIEAGSQYGGTERS